jgi:small subunit ribosomal protein S3
MGMIGIKVWICKGEVFGKRDLSTYFAPQHQSKGKQGGHGGQHHRPKRKR